MAKVPVPSSDAGKRPAREVRLAGTVPAPRLGAVEIASYLAALLSLWLVLQLKLLGALLAGLLVYQVVHSLSPLLEKRLSGPRARMIGVALLSIVIVGALAGAVVGIIAHFEHDVPNLQRMLVRMMSFVDQARGHVPDWAAGYLPVDTDDLKIAATKWLQAHIAQLQEGGMDAARAVTHIVIGLVLGAIVVISANRQSHRLPLAAALATRVARFADAFRRIVFAQVKISAINAALTAVYLLAALPLFHSRLPLSKTMVLIAFVVGLLPVIGNLVSNAVIILVSLSVGLPVAIASLVFLIVIHKFEYFLNAQIIGNEIEARAWELLVAMLVMEAAFGLFGLLAAPIYYAYIKRELLMLRVI
jgi:predicted PurR-regulated permease PerM